MWIWINRDELCFINSKVYQISTLRPVFYFYSLKKLIINIENQTLVLMYWTQELKPNSICRPTLIKNLIVINTFVWITNSTLA